MVLCNSDFLLVKSHSVFHRGFARCPWAWQQPFLLWFPGSSCREKTCSCSRGWSACSSSSSRRVCGLALMQQGSDRSIRAASGQQSFVGITELPGEWKWLFVWAQSWLGCSKGFAVPFFFVNRKALCPLSLSSLILPLNTAQTLLLLFLQPSCCLPYQHRRKGKISYQRVFSPHKQGVGTTGWRFRCVWTALSPYTLTDSSSVCISFCNYISSSVLPVLGARDYLRYFPAIPFRALL